MKATKDAKPLSSRAIETMKPGDKDKSDTVENRGLRISCGATGVKTFYYRYTSPITGKLAQIKIGNYPQISLASARVQLQILKQMRQQDRCPVTERKQEKEAEKQAKQRQREETILTVKDLVELYLTGYIEDRCLSNGKVILGARKPKGQSEARRTLYGDAVRVLGERPAAEITRKDVVALIMQIIERGANVQTGNVLRELSSAYEYAIGLEKFDDDFANPALQAKASLRQSKTKFTPQKGKRIFTDKELAKFLQWLPTSAYPQKAQHIFRLTLWTGCRTGEICNIAWDDIDCQQKTVHIRQSKTDVERYVQLSDQAIAFLKKLQTSAD